jgi:hypothetical protein
MSSTTVSRSGTVLENFSMNGTLTISASNVTVRNFKIVATGNNGIKVQDGLSGVVIEDGEIEGSAASAVSGDGFTARRLYIHDTGADAFSVNNRIVIEGSYITRIGSREGTHADGLQMTSGGDVVIRGNYFHMPASDTEHENSQIFMIKPDMGPIDGVTIEGNWLNGGGYSVQVVGTPTNVLVRNNRFGTDYNFGPLRVNENTTVCGNVWDATGIALVDQTLPASSCPGGIPASKTPVAPVLGSVQ